MKTLDLLFYLMLMLRALPDSSKRTAQDNHYVPYSPRQHGMATPYMATTDAGKGKQKQRLKAKHQPSNNRLQKSNGSSMR